MSDRVLRGTTKNKNIRFFAVDATDTVKEAVKLHNLSITNTVILGRLLSAGLMLGMGLKDVRDEVTIKIRGDGPAEGAIVSARMNGQIKGYVYHPEIELPRNPDSKTIDVKNAIGNGTLTIMKDLGLKKPYSGTIELVSGEIAEDLAYYYLKSEQIPTAIGLGVLIEKDGSVKQAGGFLIQLMPNTPEEDIVKLETSLNKFPNLTDLMDMGYSIETLINKFIMKEFEIEIFETINANFHCDCSKENFRIGIKTLGKKEIQDIIETDGNVTAQCHFCSQSYLYDTNDLNKMLDEMK